MANAAHKNTIWVDATGSITVSAIKPVIRGILITPSAAASLVLITETDTNGTGKIEVRIDPNESRYISFHDVGGIEITTTFFIKTLTNITSVILIGDFYLQV